MADAETKWKDLPDEAKEAQIFDALILEELGAIEPVFTAQYINAKAQTKDAADKMRLDIQMFDKVAQLRKDGKMQSPDELRKVAKGMVKLESDQMRKALFDFSGKIRGQQSGRS